MISNPVLRIPLPQIGRNHEKPKERTKKANFFTPSQTLNNSSSATKLNLSTELKKSPHGVKQAAQVLSSVADLQTLNLSNNNLNSQQFAYLAKHLRTKKLCQLNLAGNNLCTEGAQHLAKLIKKTHWQLVGTWISAETILARKDAWR